MKEKGIGKGVFSKSKNTNPVPRKGSSLPSGGMSKDSAKANSMAKQQAANESLRGKQI